MLTGCDLAPSARIGRDVVLQHWGVGVVVGSDTVIQDGAILFPKSRILKTTEDARVIIGRRAQLGGNCTIVSSGVLRIGDGAHVCAGTVIRESVADGHIAVGASVTTLAEPLRMATGKSTIIIALHRLMRWLHVRRVKYLPGFFYRLNIRLNHSFLPPDVQLGQRVKIDFGAGLVDQTIVGNDTYIGPNVSVVRNVRQGKSLRRGRVIIGSHVRMERDSVVIASELLEIGDGVHVEEGAIVTRSVPPGCTVAGAPARVVSCPAMGTQR